jgi:Holliday junction DNA helicase RuvA
MFDYLSGTVSNVSANQCVLDTHGIGWSLTVSTKSAARLTPQKPAKLFTYLNMGSSDRAVMELFGFDTRGEREIFILLIGISGIGPKAAISILSALSPEELSVCVLAGDAKSLTVAPGIGLKGAQKIILELKDKLKKNITSDGMGSLPSKEMASSGDLTEAVNALIVLGYAPQLAASAVKKVASQAKNLQDLIRLALKTIGENDR